MSLIFGHHAIPLDGVCFTHVDDSTGEQTVFLVSEIEKDPRYQALKVYDIPVTPDHARQCIERCGLEEPRLTAVLTVALERKPEQDTPSLTPVMVAEWTNGTHILIDGNHRYAAAYLAKWEWIKARIVPRSLWKEYQIIGL